MTTAARVPRPGEWLAARPWPGWEVTRASYLKNTGRTEMGSKTPRGFMPFLALRISSHPADQALTWGHIHPHGTEPQTIPRPTAKASEFSLATDSGPGRDGMGNHLSKGKLNICFDLSK